MLDVASTPFHRRNPIHCAGIFLLLAAVLAGSAGSTTTSHRDEPGSNGRTSAPETTDIPPDSGTSAQANQTSYIGFPHEDLRWEYCGPRPEQLGPAVLLPEPSAEDAVSLTADTFDYDQILGLMWLSGNIRGTWGSRLIAANEATYDHKTSDLATEGNVFFADPQIRFMADRAQINLKSHRGTFSDVYYRLTGRTNVHGSAAQAELVDPTLVRYRNIVYSTCQPGQEDWSLEATELELDQAEGEGVARHAKLRIRGLPVLYTPYLPLLIDNRRRSGLLVPTAGNSDSNGIDVTVPYYWNIAPNIDATISARYMSKRGPMLGSEFRYLSPRQKVRFYGEFLPEDGQLESRDRRWALRIEQTGSFGRGWSTAVDYNAVSDDEYFEDFGGRLEKTSTRSLERRGDLNYSGNGWHLRARLQKFQSLDATLVPGSRPYARFPQVVFAANPHRIDPGIELGISGEYNYFHHDTLVHGHRTTLQSYARWPLHKHYGHLIPQVNFYLAGYDLQDQQAGKDARPFYGIPSFNLDAELAFERTVKWFGQESLQTLEPRIFYLYTPFQDQDDSPVFDSTELSFNYDTLFRPNRFSGSDRIGDANQLTLGLTSRILSSDSGEELLQANIGQILYARNRDVRISSPPEEENSSPIAGLVNAQLLQNWTGHASFEYNPHQKPERLRKRTLELRYRKPGNRLFNLAYRFDFGTSEATRYEGIDLSFSLPVNQRFQLVGRWNHSLLNRQTTEVFAGLEYGRCCWRVRLLARHLRNKPDRPGINSVMLQIELPGLGSIGSRVDKFFEHSIYGYFSD